MYSMVSRVLGENRDAWGETSWAQELYLSIISFYRAIINTGLIPVLILDGSQPNHEINARRKGDAAQEKNWASPLTSAICRQAYLDLGLETLISLVDADRLLITWYRQNEQKIFAVLTDDSDFLVLGVRTIVHFPEITMDDESVTLYLWDVDSCWRGWQRACGSQSRSNAIAPRIDLLIRSQVAAVLGNDVNKTIRTSMEMRNKALKQWSSSPTQAARSIILRGGKPLDLSFFRNRADDYKLPGLDMKSFDESDLQAFEEIVNSYLEMDREARKERSVSNLVISEDSLPWLDAWMLKRLKSAALPQWAINVCFIGSTSLTIPPGPSWSCCKEVREAFASSLMSTAPGPSYEYEPNSNTFNQLNGFADGSRAGGEHARNWWFVLPVASLAHADRDVKPPSSSPSSSIEFVSSLRKSSPSLTARAIKEAYPDLAKCMVSFNALLVHAMTPPSDDEGDASFSASVRDLLLPGLPQAGSEDWELIIRSRTGGDNDEGEKEGIQSLQLNDHEGIRAEGKNLIDVGSQLSQEDWDDIDNDDTVNKVKASPGFTLMAKIVAYDDASQLLPPTALPESTLVELFYLLQYVRGASSLWEKLIGSCYPSSSDPAVAKDLKAKKKVLEKGKPGSIDARVEEIKKSLSSDKITSSWVQCLSDYAAELTSGGVGAARALLAVCRHGVKGGPNSPQWSAATLLVKIAPPRLRKDTELQVWGSHNSSSSLGGSLLPSRHPHQQALMDLVSSHLSSSSSSSSSGGVLPLRVILSTPTGSGKTFLALMLHLQCLSAPQEGKLATQRGQEGFPNTVLVYCVPTKQVLKRVGTECEAHRVIYWTAAAVGEGDLHEVRRPYSVRRKQKGGGNIGSSSIQSQLDLCEKQARNMDDLRPTPLVIIADVKSTAALVLAAESTDPDSWYHSKNLLLYFDEPNMGIHIDLDLAASVKKIMRHAPFTTILASATLPSWEELPRWWKGKGGASRCMIALEPYGLPQSNLEVMTHDGLRIPVNIFQLFKSPSGLTKHLNRNERRRILLLRHLSPENANHLIAHGSGLGEVDSSDWSKLGMDVRSLRSEYLERLLLNIDTYTFAALRKAWTLPTIEVTEGIKSLISKNGVTMIATLDPRRLALELAGLTGDSPSSSWLDAKAALKDKVRMAKENEAANRKAQSRSQKKDDEQGGRPDDEEDTTILLRSGLKVSLGEAESTEDDIMVMLSKGIAYVRANDVEPLVKRLYRNALLHLPDRVTKQPPIHVLVVDYSAIYGTDCQAVDTLYMCEDLGELLSFEDHQQFIGRLRRDGTAVYPSLEMLRRATLGLDANEEEEDEERMVTDDIVPKKILILRDSISLFITSCSDGSTSNAQLTSALQAIRSRNGEAASVAEVRAKILTALLLSFDHQEAPEKLFALSIARIKQWGEVKPLQLLALKKPSDQSGLILAVRDACLRLPSLLKAAPKLLQFLYDKDLIEEEAFLIWKARDNENGTMPSFRQAIDPLLKWIEEAESEEEN